MNNLKENIMARIEKDAIAIRSKHLFTLQRTTVGVLAIGAFLVSTHLFATLLLSLRASGASELFIFGARGFSFFLSFFPWHLLAFDILLIMLIAHLVKRWEWGWKTPRLYLAVFLLMAVFAAGTLISNAPSFKRFNGPPPPLPLGGGFTRGTVLSAEEGFVTIIDERTGDITEIALPEGFGISGEIHEGTRIIVVGEEQNGFIEAFGIRGTPFKKTNE